MSSTVATSKESHSSNAPTSTIAPPAWRGTSAPRRTGGYVSPRLDLTTLPVVPTSDLECLTQAVYYEARTESEEGQAAVAEVVLNRTRSTRYPDKVCAVVYQRNSRTCQFTFTCDGAIGRVRVNMTSWAQAEQIARSALAGERRAGLPDQSVNYHANYVRPSWGRRLERVRQIGAHIFYGAPLKGHQTPGSYQGGDPRPSGTNFVRNDAMDRAYAAVMSQQAPSPVAPVEAVATPEG